MMKFFLFVLLSFSNLSTPAFSQDFKWIAISDKVHQALIQENKALIHFYETDSSMDEIFLKIKEDDLNKLSGFIHTYFKSCGGYRVLPHSPKQEKKLLFNKSLTSSEYGYYDFQKSILPNYSIDQENLLQKYFANISIKEMNQTIIDLSAFHTRYYKAPEGIEAMNWIANKWGNITKIRNDVKIEKFKHSGFDQPSVILTIEGTDANLKDQIIILGGHADSINTDDEGIHSHAPGADDNAAGIAVLTEILRNLVVNQYAPKHTIQFIAYAAEEVGIQGSYQLSKHYRENKIKVLGKLQFDGVNYNKLRSYDLSIISDNTNEEQNLFLAKLVDTYLQVSWTWQPCGYACSDHAAWNYEGYRASYAIEALMAEENPYIHTAKDTFDKSDNSSEHAALFTKLGLSYLIELDQ